MNGIRAQVNAARPLETLRSVLERVGAGAEVFHHGGVFPGGFLARGEVAPAPEEFDENVRGRGRVADSEHLFEGGLGKAQLTPELLGDAIRIGSHGGIELCQLEGAGVATRQEACRMVGVAVQVTQLHLGGRLRRFRGRSKGPRNGWWKTGASRGRAAQII